MKTYVLWISFFVLVFFPHAVFADIRITEIAWMGTTQSSFAEWFELYNDGVNPVDVSGWKLYKDSGAKIVYTLTKQIGAGEYLVVERTTPSVPDPIPGISDESGPFSNSGFANTGENLVLKDASDATIETLSYASGWPAGDVATKDTMQWNGSVWITAAATPKLATAGSSPSQTQSQTTSSSASLATDSSTAAHKTSEHFTAVVVSPRIDFNFPEVVYKDVGYDFTAAVYDNSFKKKGYFVWNMGDGTMLYRDDDSPIHYTYHYSGTYGISLAYYYAKERPKPIVLDTKFVKVFEPTISAALVGHDAVKIGNTSNTTIDISAWKVSTDTGNFVFPPMTFIAPSSSMTLSTSQMGMGSINQVSIQSPEGFTVAQNTPVAFISKNIATQSVKKTVSVAQEKNVTVPIEAPLEESAQADHRIRTIVLVGLILIGAACVIFFEYRRG